MENLVGQSLNRYKIVALLGEGGMGAVYKGSDVTLQRDVAIKVMHPHIARQGDFQERFLQEARTAAKLDHPGIVKVFDFGQAKSHLYIVMEFIPGDNLRKMLGDLRAAGQWIILPEAIQIVQQVSLALDYAHRQGILHRDMKPDNIMLKAESVGRVPYRPVITDLGLAKLREGGMLTQEGTSMGTPAYMSPEQAKGEATDARSDVYSLGVLLYELAVSRLPFAVKTITEAIRCHTQEPPPPPRSIRADLPEPVEEVILRCLEKKPADRYPDARTLADALEKTLPQASMVSSPPTALAKAVSLMTAYQQSLVEMRGPSIMAEFPEVPPELTGDRITVLTAEHTTRHFQMKSKGMTIGRHADNDIVLDDPKVSRQHAQITFDGTNYCVTDLNSSNGTYLGNVKLLPGVPEIWPLDKAVRIGNGWLRLERGKRAAGAGAPSILRSDGTILDPSLIRSSAGPGRVGVFMESKNLEVAPGGSTVASIVILNQGPVVDHFKISVLGIPANWVSSIPAPLRLMPGAQQDVTLAIQPPRTPKSRAGAYPVTIQVASQDMPNQVATVQAQLNVQNFSQFSSEMRPQRIRAGTAAQVSVNNQGNQQETFTVAWQDRANEIVFQPHQTQLNVLPGQSAAAGFYAVPRERRLIGGTTLHNFTAQVTSPTGETQRHEGEIAARALIPPWLIGLLLLMCICLAGAAALAYGWKTSQDASATQTLMALWQSGSATETALAATRSATAQAGQATIAAATTEAAAQQLALGQAQTGTALALENANQATVMAVTTAGAATSQAATTTAVWLPADDDRDGLPNQQEIDLNTLPDKRDTDEDGLDDGEEVTLYGTDPLRRDTDNDGLDDGAEIARGTNPKSADTDADGLKDNVDPDPLNAEAAPYEPGGIHVLPLATFRPLIPLPDVIHLLIPPEDKGGAINAHITYHSYNAASGWVTFRIANTGESTLESAEGEIKNRTTNAPYYGPAYSDSPFRDEPTSDTLVAKVAPDTTKYMRYKLSGNPTGAPCRAIIKLFSADGKGGLNITKTVDFDLP